MDDEQTPQLSHGNEEQQPLLNHDGNEVQHEKISQFEAGYHIICIVAGTGLLQLPYALAHSGWAGLFLIAFLAAVNCYTGIIIIKLLISTGKTLEGYPQIGEAAFGRIGYYLVSFFYNTAMGGSACLYLVLVGMNFNELFGGLNSQQWTFLVSLMILIPFLSVKTLKEVGFVSLLGVLTSVVVVVIIVIGSSMDFDAYKDKVTHEFFKADSLGSVLGTLCFSYGGNYVFPEVNRSMRDKAQFPKVMIISIGLITMLYMCSGVSGYLTYGNLSLSPILLNLPKGLLRTISTGMITLHVVFAIPLLLTTISRDTERSFGTTSIKTRSLLRIALVVFISSISVSLPYFADLLSLIGAVSNTMLIFVLPIACDFILNKNTGISYVIGGGIMVIGLIGGSMGTYEALIALYNDITRGY